MTTPIRKNGGNLILLKILFNFDSMKKCVECDEIFDDDLISEAGMCEMCAEADPCEDCTLICKSRCLKGLKF